MQEKHTCFLNLEEILPVNDTETINDLFNCFSLSVDVDGMPCKKKRCEIHFYLFELINLN